MGATGVVLALSKKSEVSFTSVVERALYGKADDVHFAAPARDLRSSFVRTISRWLLEVEAEFLVLSMPDLLRCCH